MAINNTTKTTVQNTTPNTAVKWQKIEGRPKFSPSDIDASVNSAHVHTNKSVLNALGVSDGKLTYNGNVVGLLYNEIVTELMGLIKTNAEQLDRQAKLIKSIGENITTIKTCIADLSSSLKEIKSEFATHDAVLSDLKNEIDEVSTEAKLRDINIQGAKDSAMVLKRSMNTLIDKMKKLEEKVKFVL